ncbi:McrB family protein [Bacillus sp. V5-8f]|uniref:McrB family protein n=1 Tax=Bacillus sp. V5-8f TaxID=2053044 RepID=UPI000C778481|nr:DUF3578 domain-containing protein [Bacillus sp. V5-8f]PLT32707.1 DUF3578 domain-containing protein [Bacillus sp. V5-8f]
MLEKMLGKLAENISEVTTLSTGKSNFITKKDHNGIYVETHSSREKFKNGTKDNPFEHISFDFIEQAWKEFTIARTATANEFIKTRGRSSFLMAMISKLPFVEVVNVDGSMAVKLKEFKTDDLPCEKLDKVIQFLEDVILGTYDPKHLSKQVNADLYKVKSNSRQDLRIIGVLNKNNDINQDVLQLFLQIDNKKQMIQNLVQNHQYFQITLTCLSILKDFSKSEKRRALEELGMLIVRNSMGDNLMVESVAKQRTLNLLTWLEDLQLIDSDWTPIDLNLSGKVQKVETQIREYLLKIANEYLDSRRQEFGGNPLASFIRHDVPNEFGRLSVLNNTNYLVAASAGKGNWTSVPWISILNKEVTNSTQKGYYLVYLFSEDMKRLYLSFAQGVTETSKEDMLRIKQEIRNEIKMEQQVKRDDNIYLGDSNRAKQYATSTAAYIEYDLSKLPSQEEIIHDLSLMIVYYEEFIELKTNQYKPVHGNSMILEEKEFFQNNQELIDHIHSFIKSKGFFYTREEVINLFLSLKTKPFVILSGISGTGKTKIVQWFAESVGATEENGQFTLIPIRPDWNDGSDLLGYVDIKGDFKEGQLTKIIQRAEGNPDLPYFVLLDEMNLARVEHYFSDILSVMESRKWQDGRMVTSNLLSTEVAGSDIKLPTNLYIIGTVNMDETTHPFSKKVLDRANTIEFNRVELSNVSFLEELEEVEPISVSDKKFHSEFLHLKDLYQKNKDLVLKTTSELEFINQSLQLINAHIGYRVRDEICFYLAYNEASDLLDYDQAFDYCILQKILPRVSGSDSRVERLLMGLYRLFTGKEFLEESDDLELDFKAAKYPISAAKVVEMLRRLRDDGFTSFWIS